MNYYSHWWQRFIPRGVAFAMGSSSNVALVASGLVVGEAVASFLSVALASTPIST
ncbi:hypothetical protein P171DRAFT_504616 [Karstenula rhodostoma CBS 690.94]|uniref:Uncharacterized protein n=1 Tax=Karstenula rhodostoma CBS 690.94 TaxID=1392251 RepID=A0A9P4U6S4_9PLEO|nr:hypothetical protein P171DRAFT_504616 [Karstenula rhodostoma CBS 690.94]